MYEIHGLGEIGAKIVRKGRFEDGMDAGDVVICMYRAVGVAGDRFLV